jgi:hypothetical protein
MVGSKARATRHAARLWRYICDQGVSKIQVADIEPVLGNCYRAQAIAVEDSRF